MTDKIDTKTGTKLTIEVLDEGADPLVKVADIAFYSHDLTVVLMENATSGGAPAVQILARDEDDQLVILETTGALFLSAAGALCGAWDRWTEIRCAPPRPS